MKVELFSHFKIYLNDEAYNFFNDVFIVLKELYGIDSMVLLDMDHDKCMPYGVPKNNYNIDDWMRKYIDLLENEKDIHFSLDCENDPQFRDMFDNYGARVSIFIPIRFFYKSQPNFAAKEVFFSLHDIININFTTKKNITENDIILLGLLVNQYVIRFTSLKELNSFININAAIYEGLPFGLMTMDKNLQANINSSGRKILELGDGQGMICTGMGICYSCDRRNCPYREKHMVNLTTVFSDELTAQIKEKIDLAYTTLEVTTLRFWFKKRFLQMKIVPFIFREEDLMKFYNKKEVDSIINYIVSFQDVTEAIENQKLKREMEIARQVQIDLLPKRTLPMDQFDLKAAYIPALDVGGDYYDYIQLGNRLGIVIGDVAGKGVSAAFFMAELKGVISSAFTFFTETIQIVEHINDYLLKTKKRNFFITMIIGIFHMETREFIYMRCGHNEPVFIANKTARPELMSSNGIGLNLVKTLHLRDFLEQKIVNYEPGDCFFLYTDGVTERMNEKGELYGDKRLLTVLSENTGKPSSEIIKAVLESVKEFAGKHERNDDITILCIRPM